MASAEAALFLSVHVANEARYRDNSKGWVGNSRERKGRMVGKVSKIEQGSVFVDLGKGLRCWFAQLTDHSIEIGDSVMGDLWSFGGQELHNTTRGYRMKVFIEGHL
jgi:uncharacterized protein YkvS